MTYSNQVVFRLLSAAPKENVDLAGTVSVQDGEMILDIHDVNAASPYHIVGVKRGHYFEGTNSAEGGYAVSASWADCGGLYVGKWIEEDIEFLFSFGFPGMPKT